MASKRGVWLASEVFRYRIRIRGVLLTIVMDEFGLVIHYSDTKHLSAYPAFPVGVSG
jgi:hypothetical protein